MLVRWLWIYPHGYASLDYSYLVLFLMYLVTILKSKEGFEYYVKALNGYSLAACPQILFLAAFLLLLSFWYDLHLYYYVVIFTTIFCTSGFYIFISITS